jgi:hypothetical protein
MIVVATDKLLSFASGTNRGDLTGGGGIDTCFDDDVTEAQAACATAAAVTSGYAGRTLASSAVAIPKRAWCYGSSDAGYVSAINPTVTLDLYGKTGAAPSTSTDGTLIGTVSFTDTANESATKREIALSTTNFQANHIWVRISHNGAANTTGIAEIIVYEDWAPTDELGLGYTLDNGVIGYDNIVTTSNLTSTTEDSDFPVVNLANHSTSLKWRGTSVVADEYITVTVSGQTIDYVGIGRHNFATGAISVSLEGRTVSDHQYIELIEPFTPTSDGPLIMQFAPRADITSLRVRLQPGTIEPEAAVFYVGELLTLQRRLYVGHAPMTMARETNSVAALSESGEFLGRFVLGQYSESEIALNNLTPDWVRDSLDPFLEHALEFPFFFAWRPDTYPNETALAWFPPGSSPKPENSRSNGMMAITMPIMGITT